MRKGSFDFEFINRESDDIKSVKSGRTNESCHSIKICQHRHPYTPHVDKFEMLSDLSQKADMLEFGHNRHLCHEYGAEFLRDPKKCNHTHCDGISGGHCDGHEDFHRKHFHPCHHIDCDMKSLDHNKCMKECQSCIDDCDSCQIDVSFVNTTKKANYEVSGS